MAAAGAGTLSGFEFAAAGALDVTGAVPSSETLILDLTVEDSPSLANVTNWSLNRDGVADTKHRIRVLNDKIVISPPGMMFFVR